MTNQTIRFRRKQLIVLFPDEFTKMREEDFLNKAVENRNILNDREFNALINLKSMLHNRQFREHFEFYVRREKDKIELIAFDD